MCEKKMKLSGFTSMRVWSPPLTIGTVLPAWMRYCPMEWPFKFLIGLTKICHVFRCFYTDLHNGIAVQIRIFIALWPDNWDRFARMNSVLFNCVARQISYGSNLTYVAFFMTVKNARRRDKKRLQKRFGRFFSSPQILRLKTSKTLHS